MISEEIEKCITKYLFQSADVKDLDLLNDWIEDKENQILLKEYVKTNFAINLAMNDPNIEDFKKQLLKEIRKQKNPFLRYKFSIIKYVAIAIVFLTIGFWSQMHFNDLNSEKQVKPRTDVITLELENGDIQVISEDGSSKILRTNGKRIAKQKGSQLIYDQDNHETKISYNTLHIPNGKQFNIVLSDGTKVHLNSGSTLTYPVKFLNDSLRKVTLVGEAYFDVTHNEKNKFIVKAQELEVQVYGTQFNISNYPEDENTEVVLVKGSVSLMESNKNTESKEEFYLTPGFKGTFNKTNKQIIDEKVNISLYTSWMNGNIVFRDAPFEDIIRKLERSYNVIIINNNKKLAKETFNATIETKYETIDQVLNYFNKVYQIQYSIIENKVIIN
ncbi:FecR family protein [Confluentibacter lentus]|uniref:FecR family protein n=1 Tax=Confluentibacter lentus TaxID=1699412 RepID=UPI000C286C11|nr:FecR family protein [Confluentibacter lentus]